MSRKKKAEMMIDFSPSKYVINVSRKIGKRIESDLLFRALRFCNNTDATVRIEEITFDLIAKHKIIKRVSYPKQALSYQFKRVEKSAPQIQGYGSKVFLGRDRFFKIDKVTSSLNLKGGQETGILLQHYRVVYKVAIDTCFISIYYTVEGMRKRLRKRIQIVTYKNKNNYIFPLRGAWFVVNNYDNVHEHRQMHSQEFAMDLIQLTKDFKLSSSRKFANKDYPSYNKKVYAIARGKIVDCFNDFPENPPGLGSRLPKKRWEQLMKQFGFMPGVAGNYVILKHRGNEYSFYAHLVPGSVRLKKDSVVKKGDVIGRLGNSGNSDAPHLHFQLMDGPNFLSARGLPCFFTNVKGVADEPIEFIEENNSIIFAK